MLDSIKLLRGRSARICRGGRSSMDQVEYVLGEDVANFQNCRIGAARGCLSHPERGSSQEKLGLGLACQQEKEKRLCP